MSYTVVPTVATGDVWTASSHNLYIRDNFRATAPDQVTAKGDLIIGDGANTLSVLAVGGDGRYLSSPMIWETKYDLLHPTSGGQVKDVSEGGSGNIHVPTDFADVLTGASWAYGAIMALEAASTAYLAIYPSSDTTIEIMRVGAISDTGFNVCHGFWPIDSTGGMYYLATDTFISAKIYIFAWMY